MLNSDAVKDELMDQVQVLNSTLWENRAQMPVIEEWLNNFNATGLAGFSNINEQRLYALHLLSQFMYFGIREVRTMLSFMYEHMFMYPIKREIRKELADTLNTSAINLKYESILQNNTRFLGIGNPSESGCHLLYYFRQENQLSRKLFIQSHEIFSNTVDKKTGGVKLKLKDDGIVHYVFVDDFCGAGSQATIYSNDIVNPLKSLNPDCVIHYFSLLATTKGMEHVKSSCFDDVQCVFELDDSFRCFSDSSRFFIPRTDGEEYFNKDNCKRLAKHYGDIIYPANPLGFDNGQFLVGFSHNTPDNTLPIIWESDSGKWFPMFKRYNKKYTW